jgi:hypothetical protein
MNAPLDFAAIDVAFIAVELGLAILAAQVLWMILEER